MTFIPDLSRDWQEDFSHENGNYECICVHCAKHFIGHKRRIFCKYCSNQIEKGAKRLETAQRENVQKERRE